MHRLKIYWQRLSAYISEIQKFKRNYPKHYSLFEMLKFFLPWFFSLRFGASPLKDEIPWMTFKAIEFLNINLVKNMRVFEYGSGGSTIFFGLHGCEVFSVEHDKNWYNAVQTQLHKRKMYACKLFLISPTDAPEGAVYSPQGPQQCLSDDLNFLKKSFYRYVHVIDGYPDGYFDFVVIDGRARNSCFVNCLSKVKCGGYIVWDNTDRQSYSNLVNSAHEGLEFIDFPGPSPYADFFTRTSIWKKNK